MIPSHPTRPSNSLCSDSTRRKRAVVMVFVNPDELLDDFDEVGMGMSHRLGFRPHGEFGQAVVAAAEEDVLVPGHPVPGLPVRGLG